MPTRHAHGAFAFQPARCRPSLRLRDTDEQANDDRVLTNHARFYQVDNKMDAVIRYDLAAAIPVVEEESGALPTREGP